MPRGGEMQKDAPQREMKVLALGLPRTGSLSMAAALTILGYKNVYHTLHHINDGKDWQVLSRAADATFPVLPTYTGRPFTCEQWDDMFGSCEAVTDMAAGFGPHIARAYSDAKVLLVVRDFDSWWHSFDEQLLRGFWSPLAEVFIHVIQPLTGQTTIVAIRKSVLGFFEAKNVNEIRQHARMAYDRHHRELKETVPPGQLLVYRMGDGWEPLCKFLGKPVPDKEFPWLNEASALQEEGRNFVVSQLYMAISVAAAKVRMLMVILGGILIIAMPILYLFKKRFDDSHPVISTMEDYSS